ncbi:MAG: mismatch repair protein [Terracidiphilus sp.]
MAERGTVAGETGIGGRSPGQVYSEELNELHLAQAAEQKRERLLGYAKVALGVATILAAVVFIHHTAVLESLLAPVAVFIVLAALHEKVLQSLRMRGRAIRFCEQGLARIQDRWAGTGETGERFLDPAHPYARDLDIFGRASLFELLCTARTRAGEETLAAWLMEAASVDEIFLRQDAVRDLKERVHFREKLFSLGETVRLGVKPEKLSAWGEREPVFPERATRVLTRTLGALWILSLVCWGVWDLGTVAAAMTVLNLAWAHRIHARLDGASDAIEDASDGLELLAGVLALLENEQFSAAKLKEIQSSLRREGTAPSAAIRKLARVVERLKSRRNPVARLTDVVTFWSALLVFKAERWQKEFGPQIRGWLAAAGKFEALTALSGYAYEHAEDVFPEFAGAGEGVPLFEAEGLVHPLLPARLSVRNDLKFGDGLQLIVLSGPNMAGKSTFIRCIGVNAVLAQCGAPVRARRLKLSPLQVAASICILDSLSGGVSRFYAEIHRIKLVFDLTRGPVPVLFLLDELLSGTNSHDRLVGTQFVVRGLVDHGAIGMVSTHDLALAKIPETMGERAANFHFEDRFDEGELIFDYTLKPGIVKTSNALELMRSIGLDVGERES